MTVKTVAGLAEAGLVEAGSLASLEGVAARYAVAITPLMGELIDRGDAHDPIAAQFVPHADELVAAPEERLDPIGDDNHSPVPGVVHRYPDRVLLKVVQVCAVYCRFCFRREMVGPGEDAVMSPEALDRALDYVEAQDAIWEVILTGGDPLMLSPRRMAHVTARLRAIPHVKVLRVHTRIPVAAPERITDALLEALKGFGRATYVALHANHEREMSPAAREACARIVDAGFPMLSQSVLLRGVNDSPAALEALMRCFVENRIKPYYLHHADLAPGTRRFRTSIATGQRLVDGLRGHVSGLCQPSYVLDIPGGYGKTSLTPAAISGQENGTRSVRDRHGDWHPYPDLPDQSCG